MEQPQPSPPRDPLWLLLVIVLFGLLALAAVGGNVYRLITSFAQP